MGETDEWETDEWETDEWEAGEWEAGELEFSQIRQSLSHVIQANLFRQFHFSWH